MRNGSLRSHFTVPCLVCAAVLVLGACDRRDPVVIGISVQLTGAAAEMGLGVRNGAELAAMDINDAGGIDGRPVELMPIDDRGDPEQARTNVRDLAAAGAVAIIGNVQSNLSVAAAPVADELGIVLISPGSTTDELSGRDDWFFRIAPSATSIGAAIGSHIVETRSGRVVIIADRRNAAFSEPFAAGLIGRLRPGIAETIWIEDGDEVAEHVEELPLDVDAVVGILADADMARLVQSLRLAGYAEAIYSSSWANTGAFLQFAGSSAEGVLIVDIYDPEDAKTAAFAERYRERYGKEPNIMAFSGYDLVSLLSGTVADESGHRNAIRNALARDRVFDLNVGVTAMDRYGDVQRDVYIFEVRGGTLGRVATVPAAP